MQIHQQVARAAPNCQFTDRPATRSDNKQGPIVMITPPIDLSSQDLFDILQTTRTMRRLKPDPVPDELIVKILQAGTCAANGGNQQSWHFVVVKDAAIKKRVQVWYRKALDEIVAPIHAAHGPPAGSNKEKYRRQLEAVEYLTAHYHEAPVWIVACLNHEEAIPSRMDGASIYPAVQNMLLAARALGLGASLTTRHLCFEQEAHAALKLPPGYVSYAILPLGYPMGHFGPVGRGRLSDVVSLDQVGQPWEALET